MLTSKESYNPNSISSSVVWGLPCTTLGTEVWAPLGPAAATCLSTSCTVRLPTRANKH